MGWLQEEKHSQPKKLRSPQSCHCQNRQTRPSQLTKVSNSFFIKIFHSHNLVIVKAFFTFNVLPKVLCSVQLLQSKVINCFVTVDFSSLDHHSCTGLSRSQADPCSRESVLKVLKESRKRDVEDEDRSFTTEQRSKRRYGLGGLWRDHDTGGKRIH